MDFYQKYELLDLIKDEGVKVFNARETATGRRITVFLFVGEQARLHADLLAQLHASQRPGHADLLEVGDNQGTPFVATEPLGGLADLKRKVMVPQAPPAAPKAERPPDAFTRVGVWHIPAPTLSGAQGTTPVTPPPPAATAPGPPPQAAAGEFTRMFRADAAPQPIGEVAPPVARPAAGVPPPAPPAQSLPGEFTRMFRADAAPQPIGEVAPPAAARPAAGVPPPAPPAQGGAGEFTRFFQSPLSRTPAPGSEPAAPPPASSGPGEFTRIFGRGDLPAAQAGPVRPESPPPATPAPSSGPGEYTRMFSAQPVPQPQPPAPALAPPQATAPTTGKKVPWVTLALIAAVVVLLAMVAIMAFALRK